MKPERMRIRIAEHLGWTQIETSSDQLIGLSPTGKLPFLDFVPDFPNDLNACAELKKTLNEEQSKEFSEQLCALLLDYSFPQSTQDVIALIGATAPHYCEAFCKTVGIWEE